MNIHNHVVLIGRLAKAPKFFENGDGSHRVILTMAVRRNYKTGGEFKTDFVPVSAFIKKDAKIKGLYDGLAKGQLISIQGEVVVGDPYEKDGGVVYPTPSIQIQTIDTSLESKATRDARALTSVDADELAE